MTTKQKFQTLLHTQYQIIQPSSACYPQAIQGKGEERHLGLLNRVRSGLSSPYSNESLTAGLYSTSSLCRQPPRSSVITQSGNHQSLPLALTKISQHPTRSQKLQNNPFRGTPKILRQFIWSYTKYYDWSKLRRVSGTIGEPAVLFKNSSVCLLA